jgi:hypothetical protein
MTGLEYMGDIDEILRNTREIAIRSIYISAKINCKS